MHFVLFWIDKTSVFSLSIPLCPCIISTHSANLLSLGTFCFSVRPPWRCVGDMWPDRNQEEEPDWVKSERDQFQNFRDKNKDGLMDAEEVKDWLIPPDYDHSEAEARHLIYESDRDRVCVQAAHNLLTVCEIPVLRLCLRWWVRLGVGTTDFVVCHFKSFYFDSVFTIFPKYINLD